MIFKVRGLPEGSSGVLTRAWVVNPVDPEWKEHGSGEILVALDTNGFGDGVARVGGFLAALGAAEVGEGDSPEGDLNNL